ncbi:ankyrin repeat protein [Thecamonas trahens ATCC 50062]|uniref:Ankyrin repeat protein n=1 Tax=Thecamonas trahens ATCC 50062 TaxID=461836 RepID=A0A0L0D4W9_THETB|nr:ankyrin repeat protein [Thecamonas trahens ATCC 50062]KNC47417.1 ankyrin repeat protein [Thecamonas trahens ATCC 50062]|eukprot:XP_013759753.1 ankyrin repeat protein [Thecamonas trahens ATCC 50062]
MVLICYDMDFQAEHEEIGHARLSLLDLATGAPNRLVQLRLRHADRGRISFNCVIQELCPVELSLSTVRLDRASAEAALVDLEGAFLELDLAGETMTTEPCLFHQLPSWDARMFGEPLVKTLTLEKIRALTLSFRLCMLGHGDRKVCIASIDFDVSSLLDSIDVAAAEAELASGTAPLALALPFSRELVLNVGTPIGPFSGSLHLTNYPRLRQAPHDMERAAALQRRIAAHAEVNPYADAAAELAFLAQPSAPASTFVTQSHEADANSGDKAEAEGDDGTGAEIDIMTIAPDPASESGEESDESEDAGGEGYGYDGPNAAVAAVVSALDTGAIEPVLEAMDQLRGMFHATSAVNEDESGSDEPFAAVAAQLEGPPPVLLALHYVSSKPALASLIEPLVEKAGFDLETVSVAGLAPLDVAVRSQAYECMTALLKLLARRSVKRQQVARERAIELVRAEREARAAEAKKLGGSSTGATSRRKTTRGRGKGRGRARVRGRGRGRSSGRRGGRDGERRAVGRGSSALNTSLTSLESFSSGSVPVVNPNYIEVESNAFAARVETLFSVCRVPNYRYAEPLIRYYGHALASARDENGNTALHLVAAVKEGDENSIVARDVLSITRDLIAAGAPLDAQRADGATPLSLTLAVGSFGMAQMLLEAGADVNLADAKGQTALIIAVQMGLDDMIENLLAHNADPNVCNTTSQSALHIAAAFNKYSAIPRLLNATKYGANQDAYAMRLDADGRTALHVAALMGQLDALEQLLKYPAVDISARDANGLTALELAKSDDVRRELQAHGATKENDAALLAAADTGDLATVQRLVQPIGEDSSLQLAFADATHSVTALTAMHYAARRGHTDVMQALLEAGANANAVFNLMGWTALYAAAYHGREAAVQLLLEAGADPQTCDLDGMTPLHAAAGKGHLLVVTTLLGAGADVEGRTHAGWTPLHVAAYNGKLDIIRALLESGAEPGAIADLGRSPLDYAANAQVAELLRSALRSPMPSPRV